MLSKQIVATGILVGLMSMTACSGDEQGSTAVNAGLDAESVAPADTAPRGVIPQRQLQALDDAAAVEDVLQQAEEERRRLMEEAGI